MVQGLRHFDTSSRSRMIPTTIYWHYVSVGHTADFLFRWNGNPQSFLFGIMEKKNGNRHCTWRHEGSRRSRDVTVSECVTGNRFPEMHPAMGPSEHVRKSRASRSPTLLMVTHVFASPAHQDSIEIQIKRLLCILFLELHI